MNIDILTRTGSCGQSSLLDLTTVSPTVYNKVKFYVHSDQFDSDHNLILFLSSSSDPSVSSPSKARRFSTAEAFNKISDTIAPLYHSFIEIFAKKKQSLPIASVLPVIPGVPGGIISVILYFNLSVNTFGLLALNVQDSTGCCTNVIRPNFAVTSSFGQEVSGTFFVSMDVVVVTYRKFLNVWLPEVSLKLTAFLETNPPYFNPNPSPEFLAIFLKTRLRSTYTYGFQ